MLCDDLQHCCNRVVLSFAMGLLGPTVLNTPFFARSGVGYLGMREIDASYLCIYRYYLCKIWIDNRAYARIGAGASGDGSAPRALCVQNG